MTKNICGLKPLVADLHQVQRQLPAQAITKHSWLGKAVVGQAVCQACLSLVPFPCHLLLAIKKMLMAQLSLPGNRVSSLMFAVCHPNARHIYIAAEYGTTVDRVGFLAFPL